MTSLLLLESSISMHAPESIYNATLVNGFREKIVASSVFFENIPEVTALLP